MKQLQERQFFKRCDLLVITILLFIVGLIWGWLYLRGENKVGPFAEIIYDRDVVKIVYVDEDVIFSISQLPQVVFEVKDGAVAFIQSDCPDQVCVNTGWLSRPGHFAACLPNNILMFVIGEIDG